MAQFFLTPEQSRIVQREPVDPRRHMIMDTVFRQAEKLSRYGDVRVYADDGTLVFVLPSYEFRSQWAYELNPRRGSHRRRVQRDVSVTNQGSFLVVHLLSPKAKRWAKRSVGEEAIFIDDGFVAEHRYIRDLVDAMEHDGLLIAQRRVELP